jgi:hypothetical protein
MSITRRATSAELSTCKTVRRINGKEEIRENAIRELRDITESAFQEVFQQWKKRWERFTPVEGTTLRGTVLKML